MWQNLISLAFDGVALMFETHGYVSELFEPIISRYTI